MSLLTKLRNRLPRRDVVSPEYERSLAALSAVASPDPSLHDVVRQAWTMGQTIDLAGVGYGPPHWTGDDRFVTAPAPYYFFLAGLVRSQQCRRILEIGTHYGGSTVAMLRGVASQSEACVVTVDVTDLNPALRSIAGVAKIVGDANSEAVIKQFIIALGNRPIDLLYVDAAHKFLPTITNLGLYVFLFRPRFVVIDDIVLNDSMKSLWSSICATLGAHAINCVDVIPEIRAPSVGFGLLQLR
jgi:hypothetical protein